MPEIFDVFGQHWFEPPNKRHYGSYPEFSIYSGNTGLNLSIKGIM
jgi:hypothetical protein